MYLLIVLAFMSSCVQNPPQIGKTNRNLSSPNSIILLSNSTIEKKLIEQLTEYLSSINGGNPDIAISYCYPDMFIYLKQQYPDEYSIELVKESFKELINDMKKSSKERDITYSFKVGDITRRIDLGKDKIYGIMTSVVAKKGFEEISAGGEVIAVSNDNGLNWKFIQKDTISTVPILSYKFTNEVIQLVMKEK